MTQTKCVIVGAGMAGLFAANTLTDYGWDVTVLDKGRGVGGRTASRRFDGARFDHGAQYFTVRDPRMQAAVDQWLAAGVVEEWARGFPKADGTSAGNTYPRYRGAPGMTSMAKAMAEPLNVHVSTKVTDIVTNRNSWHITATKLGTNESRTFDADALLMTPPAEQTLALLAGVALSTDVVSALESITFNPCFAVMARLSAPSSVPAPGGVFMPGEPISWIADNQQKGISDAPAVTIHAGPEFTRAHYDDDQDEVARTLIAAARDVIGDAEVLGHQVLRWRYSQPANMYPEKTLFSATPAPIAFAGDAFDGARVEGAAMSGLAAADTLITGMK